MSGRVLPLLFVGAFLWGGVIPLPAAAGADSELRISAVGDIMLGGTAAPVLRESGYDHPFVHVRAFLRDSHVVFGNLEGPLTDRGEAVQGKEYVFRSPPDKVAPALRSAGFTVLSLANNHILDYGVEGLTQTLEALTAVGIHTVGAGKNLSEARRPALITTQGYTVAFLAYSLTLPQLFYAGPKNPGTAFGHERHVRADVAAARRRADIVIVSFHWGREGETTLREYQPELGHAAIEAGAHAVVGHHPHIVQGIEWYKSGVILYSLGNFTFGSYSPMATQSVVAQFIFQRSQLRALTLIPIDVNNVEVNFQPVPLYGSAADAVIEELQRLSEPLGTTLWNEGGVGVVVIPGEEERRESGQTE